MKAFLLAVFLLVNFYSFTQSDSLVNRVPEVGVLGNDFSKRLNFSNLDTILNDFYHYHLDARNNSLSLGNPGLSYSNLLFDEASYGFRSGESSFHENFKDSENHTVFYSKQPFARVSYRSGPKKYQDFDVFFTQNISKGFNYSVSYNTQSSTGFYINQETITKRFKFQNSFKTKNGKYGYFLAFKVNSGNAMENGGIKSDSLYKSLTTLRPLDTDNNKLKVQVWLEDDFNHYDSRELYLNQFLRLSSVMIDSINRREFYVGIKSEGSYNDLWFDGDNSDSNYYARYGLIIVDSSKVIDQNHLFALRNSGYFNYSTGLNKLSLLVGLNYNYFDNKNLVRKDKFDELSVYGEVEDLNIGNLKLNGYFEKGLDGFNSDGIKLKGKLQYLENGKRFQASVDGYFINTLPDYKMLNYGGNSISWKNEFDYVSRTSLGGVFIDSKWKLEFRGRLESINNFVYYSSNVVPEQYANAFGRYELHLKKKFVFGSYHFDLSIINQGVDNDAPVNLSSWIGVINFYYQRLLFKEAMELRYGIDYWQNSSYTANRYSPFTRSFVYQTDTSVGNFPYLNFYISARIKGAQGFVNFQNIGQFVFRENYMMTPEYALQDFGISFGLRWDFYN